MPDNQDARPPVAEPGEREATLATLEPDKPGQVEHRAGAEPAGPPVAPAADKPEGPKQTAWEELGFNSAEDLANSYREQRQQKNRRDGEIEAGRKATEMLSHFKEAVFGKTAPAATPPQAAPSQAPDNAGKTELSELYPEAAKTIGSLADKVDALTNQMSQDKQFANEQQTRDLETAQRKVMVDIVGDVGLDEFNRVMENPDWQTWISNHIVGGDDPKYVFDYVREKMNEARGQKMSSTDATAVNATGGALPPGGKAGGEQTPAPETAKETIIREMDEYSKSLPSGFWARGKGK